MLIEEWESDLPIGQNAASPINQQITKSPNHQIAIVGLATRFGTAASLREFQECVFTGKGAMREPPEGRWRGCDEQVRRALDLTSRRGGFIENVDIPFGRFRMPPSEVPEVLPQQLLMLQVAAEAMSDADVPMRERRGRRWRSTASASAA